MKVDSPKEGIKNLHNLELHHKTNTQNESDFEIQTGHRLFHDEAFRHHATIDLETFMKAKAEFSIRDTSSNPGPLGLFGFGLTTFLLNMHNVGVFPLSSIIYAMGIFYGGFAQLLAGIFEWHKNRMFTSVVFISYGSFWLTLVLIWILPAAGLAPAPDNIGMGFYLFIWGVFSCCFLIASIKKPRVIFLTFLTLVILFWLLALEKWTEDLRIQKVAGVVGIICSLCAIYAGFGEVINENFGYTLIPMGMPKVKETKFK